MPTTGTQPDVWDEATGTQADVWHRWMARCLLQALGLMCGIDSGTRDWMVRCLLRAPRLPKMCSTVSKPSAMVTVRRCAYIANT